MTNQNDYSLLVENVKRLAKSKGESATASLMNSGVGKDFLYNIKRGSAPSLEKIVKLAEYFGVSTDYLLGTEKRERPPVRLDLFGGQESENIKLLQQINDQVKDNKPSEGDGLNEVILQIYNKLPSDKRKEALDMLLELLKK